MFYIFIKAVNISSQGKERGLTQVIKDVSHNSKFIVHWLNTLSWDAYVAWNMLWQYGIPCKYDYWGIVGWYPNPLVI